MKRNRLLLHRILFIAIIFVLLATAVPMTLGLAIANDTPVNGNGSMSPPTARGDAKDGTSPPSIMLIEQAYQAGRIDLDTAAMYKVFSVFDPQKLPPEYQSPTPAKCATTVLLEVARNWQILKAATKSSLSSYPLAFQGRVKALYRPALSGSELTYSTTHFQIHYTLSGVDAVNPADSNSNSIPDYIEAMGTELENVWVTEITDMGWLRPPSDVSVDGNPDYDVYVGDMPYYGVTAFECYADQGVATGDNENSPGVIEHSAACSYMILENDYSGFPNTPLDDIRVTAAHEFNHAIQFGYAYPEEHWLMEATATWMEDAVYDYVNDNYQYLGYYLNNPDVAMSSQTPNKHWYGDWIFIRYISEHYGGQSTVRRIWENSITSSGFGAIQNALSSHGYSLAAVFSNFTVANYVKSTCPVNNPYCYEEAASYPSVYIEGTIDFTGSPVMYVPSDGVGNYGADYIAINSSVNDVRVTVHCASSDISYAARIVRMQSGVPTVTDIPLSGTPQSGSVDISTSGYSSIVLIVENVTPNSSSFTLQNYSVEFGPTNTAPTVTTNAAGNITANSATLNGNLTSLGTAGNATVSFEWGNTTSYGNETPAQIISAPGIFSGNITGLSPDTTYHFRARAIGDGTSYGNDMTFSTQVTPVTGITGEVDGDILPGVSITLDGTSTVMSDQNGQFQITVTTTGSHTLVAHIDGFRDRTQTINIAGLGPDFAVTCNFQGTHGLIPNAPTMQYALSCINHWLYPPGPDTGLDMQTALAVINAWLYPIH